MHLLENGVVPRVHGNKGGKPKHALTFPEVDNCAKFMKRHADIYGLPQPAPLRGRDDQPPVYLPASSNYKSVHIEYVTACGNEIRPLGLTSFREVWHQCFKHQVHDASY